MSQKITHAAITNSSKPRSLQQHITLHKIKPVTVPQGELLSTKNGSSGKVHHTTDYKYRPDTRSWDTTKRQAGCKNLWSNSSHWIREIKEGRETEYYRLSAAGMATGAGD